ncbi:copper amine oxidase N-terminal domain-containing protein [Acetivibrio cellulolyticus]|uniref:copper amine oxidase N-terminal domain-containing protein n=1 Tax=Acetivibrio cellulolyticus TaxID=35830 RepID=UPI0001E2C1BB
MIKRIVKVLAVVFILTILASSFSLAAEIPLRVVVNGEKVSFPDAQPFIDGNGRTQVPVRFVSEALGAQVDWNSGTKKVTVTLNSRKVVLTIGKKDYQINGQGYQMDTVALLVESRTFVPIRFVSEALGASVIWEQDIKTVYINFDPSVSPTPIPSAPPQSGKVTYYDGIAFNDVTDVDKYGRITVEKSKEFVLKLANQLSFVKEDGKYYIKCDYPKIPEGYEWSLGIMIYNKDGTYDDYSPIGRNQEWLIPREGSFKKEATLITNINDVRKFSIRISIDHLEMGETGLLDILYYRDGSKKRIEFVPESSLIPQEEYTDTYDFKRMFQW